MKEAWTLEVILASNLKKYQLDTDLTLNTGFSGITENSRVLHFHKRDHILDLRSKLVSYRICVSEACPKFILKEPSSN